MENYPKNTWTEEDIQKLKQNYTLRREILCKVDGAIVVVKKEEGKEHLKKKYVSTHFFLSYKCESCGRKDTRTYRKSS